MFSPFPTNTDLACSVTFLSFHLLAYVVYIFIKAKETNKNDIKWKKEQLNFLCNEVKKVLKNRLLVSKEYILEIKIEDSVSSRINGAKFYSVLF